jgi:hypothetical protein
VCEWAGEDRLDVSRNDVGGGPVDGFREHRGAGLIVERGNQSVVARQPETVEEMMMAWRVPRAARVPDDVGDRRVAKATSP